MSGAKRTALAVASGGDARPSSKGFGSDQPSLSRVTSAHPSRCRSALAVDWSIRTEIKCQPIKRHVGIMVTITVDADWVFEFGDHSEWFRLRVPRSHEDTSATGFNCVGTVRALGIEIHGQPIWSDIRRFVSVTSVQSWDRPDIDKTTDWEFLRAGRRDGDTEQNPMQGLTPEVTQT